MTQDYRVRGSAATIRLERADGMALLALGLVWVAQWVLTGPIGDFPLNDDWVYALAVRSILETGRFSLPSPASANVIAQAYWGALFCLPFGFSFTALRLSTFVIGTAGIMASYLLFREVGGKRRLAFLGAMTIAVNPFYLELSDTFMTDVPLVSLVAISLWLYVRGVQRNSRTALSMAFIVALAAILIRQFALVLPLAYAIAHLMRNGMRPRVWIAAALPVIVALLIHLGYEHWIVATGRTALLPASLWELIPRNLLASGPALVGMANRALPYLGLFTLPLLPCLIIWPAARAGQRGWWRRKAVLLVGFLAIIFFVGLVFARKFLPTLGNTLIASGFGPLTLRDMYILNLNLPVISGAVRLLWIMLSVMSFLAVTMLGVVVAGIVLRGIPSLSGSEKRRQIWLPALMISLIALYFGGSILLSTKIYLFDRYMLPLIIPCIALLVMEQARRTVPLAAWRTAACCVVLAAYSVFSVAATHDYMSWNRARWQATAALMQAGNAPRVIDGGYEFNGWYLNNSALQAKPGKSPWWVDDDEYIVAAGPIENYQQVAQFSIDRWLGLGPSSVVVLHRNGSVP